MTAEEYVKYYASGQGGYVSVPIDIALMAIEYAKREAKQQMMAKAIDGKVIANGMGNPILHLWDKGRHLIGKKVKVIVIKED